MKPSGEIEDLVCYSYHDEDLRDNIMLSSHINSTERRKMAIIVSYVAGETYGLLGPQIAGTIIQENTAFDCIVIAVAREYNKDILSKALYNYFGLQKPVIGFSTLAGRPDLFSLARELKDEGAITILAGPQADVDYMGEQGWQDNPNRFPGLSTHFSFSLHGPAEQAIYLLENLDKGTWKDTPGLTYLDNTNRMIQNPKKAWEERFLRKVSWDNIHTMADSKLVPLRISIAQVLQHIGCPHAARSKWVDIDYPVSLDKKKDQKVNIFLRGCSFCDVAVDKGFHGALDTETVIAQIRGLPNMPDGRKIPFELINENPLPGLPHLLSEMDKNDLKTSQINLTLRADWLISGEKQLRNALGQAKDMGIRILLASVGLESFDDRILANLNKGLDLETNLSAIQVMRELKNEFGPEFGYSRSDGAIHGFIHPTPWDTEDISTSIQNIIEQHKLPADILPDHSIPLIIHHASGLGDWIREIEEKEDVQFERYDSIIGWWQLGDRFTL